MTQRDQQETRGLLGLWSRASLGQRLVGGGAALGTAIGIISILVPLVVVATTRTTTVDSIAVSAQGGDAGGLEAVDSGLATSALGVSNSAWFEGIADYAVPVDAPWEELWAMFDGNPCGESEAQRAWLDEHGTPIPYPLVRVELSNTAAAGSDIIVSSIRAQGDLQMPPGDTVTVGINVGCLGAVDEGIYSRLQIGVDPVAVFDECYKMTEGSCYFGADPAPVAGDPVTFPIRPGQTRILHLAYTTAVDFRGRFVATLDVDGQQSTIDLSPDGADVIVPVVTRPGVVLSIAGVPEDVSCTPRSEDANVFVRACTFEQWSAILEGE